LQSAKLSESRRSAREIAIAQGLPAEFLSDAPFTEREKMRVIGNGVPLPMGRAIARAVREATERQLATA
jgi:site-specific DNA-cytosine methylase